MAKITEDNWQARADAQTLAEYETIMQDPKRKKNAMAAALKEATNLEKRTNAMKKAAGSKKPTTTIKRKK